MVTFAQEHVISAKRVQKMYDVSDDTVRRWFKQGLERIKHGRIVFTSREALDRFFNTAACASNPGRLTQAIAALERVGITTDKESTDGKSKRSAGT